MSVAAAMNSGKMRKLVLNRQKEYVLINVSPRWITINYGGESVFVPPGARGYAQIEREDETRAHKRASYRNPQNGKYVPGTLVVKDIVKVDKQFGGSHIIWDAGDFIAERIGENCEKEYGKRGIAWATTDASMEELARAMEEAYPRWHASEIKDAQTILAEENERLRVAQLQNRPATPPSEDVIRAREIVRLEAERHQKSIQDLMKGFRIDADGFFASAPTQQLNTPSTGEDVDALLFDANPDVTADKE